MEGNEEALALYRYMGNSCFKVSGMGDVLGFDWQSVKIMADALKIELDRDNITLLKVIESEVLKHFEKKKE